MVSEIPKGFKSDHGLRKFFETVSPVQVTSAHIAWQTGKVRKYHDKRQKFIFAYEGKEELKDKKKICYDTIPWCTCCPGGTYGDENPSTTTGWCGYCRGLPKIGDKVSHSLSLPPTQRSSFLSHTLILNTHSGRSSALLSIKSEEIRSQVAGCTGLT